MNALRALFAAIFLGMVAVTVKASLAQNILDSFPSLLLQPWSLATLADAYSGFLTFYAWVFYKERSWAARVLWFTAIMALGNIAMSFYVLLQLFRLPAGAPAESLLLRRPAA